MGAADTGGRMTRARADAATTAARTRALLVVVGLVAVAARGALLVRSGALGVGTYDDGVHYAVAASLVHGRLPYRDVLLLQPPGIAVLVAPFAALAGLIGDPAAFVLAKAVFVLLGGVNAVLVAALLRRSGPAAALTGGLLYAVASPLVYTERTVVLETPGGLGILLALLLLQRDDGRGGRAALLAGVAAGLAVGCKGWYAVPFVVLLVAARGARARFLLGGLLGGAAVLLPFFALAPARMLQEVVLAQLGRPRLGDQPLPARLGSILGVSGSGGPTSVPGVPAAVLMPVLLVAALACCALALTRREGRLFVALTAAAAAVLLLSPSYFHHYAVFVDAPLALVTGAAVGVLQRRLRRRGIRALVVVVALASVVGLNLQHDLATVRLRTPTASFARAAQAVDGCLVSDDPGLLIAVGTLSRDLAAGCDLQADPSGISYTTARWTIGGVAVDRDRNPLFQRAIVRYLTSGSAFVVVRDGALLLQPPALAVLERGPVLARGGGFVLRRTP